MPSFNALTLAHSFLSSHVRPGDVCIDATAGRGRDTVFLCRLVGDSGRVLAYDIQQDAVDETTALLEKEQLSHIGRVFQKSHDRMAEDAKPETVRALYLISDGCRAVITMYSPVPKRVSAPSNKGLHFLHQTVS